MVKRFRVGFDNVFFRQVTEGDLSGSLLQTERDQDLPPRDDQFFYNVSRDRYLSASRGKREFAVEDLFSVDLFTI